MTFKKIKSPVPSMRAALLESVINTVAKKMEKSGCTITTAADADFSPVPRKFVLTGIYGLDMLLSWGKGIPCGRFMEVFGSESAGKTALSEFLMGLWKKNDGLVHYMDFEQSRDDAHLSCYDITLSDFAYPDLITLEDGWDYISNTLKAADDFAVKHKVEPLSLYVWDSLAQSPAEAEISEKNHDDSHVGLVARGMAKGFRKHTRQFSHSIATAIFVNQVRDKIGAMGYGPKTDTPGGRAAKFAYSIRLKVSKIETLKRGDAVTGHLIEVQSVKNKFAAYPLKTRIVLSYTTGIDVDASNFLFLQENGYIVSAGKSGFYFKGFKEETFKKRDFGAWALAHPEPIKAAVIETIAEARASMVDTVTELAEDDDDADDA